MSTIFNKKNFLLIMCILLSIIIFIWIKYLTIHKYVSECFTNNESVNTSHSVDLPLTTSTSCQNFCGPQAQCAITRDQCSADIDCPGCQPPNKEMPKYMIAEVEPYDDGGKLTQNQGLHYSSLTTGYDKHDIDFAEASPGSKNVILQQPYQGEDRWMKSFNEGLNLYNKKRTSHDNYNEGRFQGGMQQGISKIDTSKFIPTYPTTVSATGLFYETTPPAANSSL
jgi:hypothetical protein